MLAWLSVPESPNPPREEPREAAAQSGYTLTGTVRWRETPPEVGWLHVIARSSRIHREVFFDPTGPFTVAGLPPGEYIVHVLNSGMHSAFVTTIEVRRDTHMEIAIRGASISGRVRDSSTGAPIAGATVEISAVPILIHDAQEHRYGTDASGSFAAGPHPAGQWRFVIRAPGYATSERAVTIGDRDIDDMWIDLQPTAGLHLILDTPDGSLPGSLELTWFDIDQNVALRLHRAKEDVISNELRWPDVPLGRGVLRISSFTSGLAGRALIVNDGKPVVIALRGGGRVTAVVPALAGDDRGAVMEVFDAEGYPVPDYGRRLAWTLHRRGEFWTTGLAAGVYQVVVTARDGRRWSGRAQVRPFEGAEVILR